jgi:hypothetical protein
MTLMCTDMRMSTPVTSTVNYAGEEPDGALKSSILLAGIYGSFLYLHNRQPVIETK